MLVVPVKDSIFKVKKIPQELGGLLWEERFISMFSELTDCLSRSDWPGEAGSVQEGHGALGSTDKTGDAHQSVFRQQTAHRCSQRVSYRQRTAGRHPADWGKNCLVWIIGHHRVNYVGRIVLQHLFRPGIFFCSFLPSLHFLSLCFLFHQNVYLYLKNYSNLNDRSICIWLFWQHFDKDIFFWCILW